MLEVHGSIRRAVCLACGGEESLAGVLAQVEAASVPRCPRCEAVLKPDVVFFGELLPVAGVLERATELARRASLMLVVGSSLEVHPVAGLPFETLAAGGSLAIVNRGPTALDEHADLRLDGGAGALLRETVQRWTRCRPRPRRAGACAPRERCGNRSTHAARSRRESRRAARPHE